MKKKNSSSIGKARNKTVMTLGVKKASGNYVVESTDIRKLQDQAWDEYFKHRNEEGFSFSVAFGEPTTKTVKTKKKTK